MLRRRFRLQPGAAYASGHELDHADPPTRSGQLPRPLVAVSNVLTRAAISTPARPPRPSRRRGQPCPGQRRAHADPWIEHRRDRPARPAVQRDAHQRRARAHPAHCARHGRASCCWPSRRRCSRWRWSWACSAPRRRTCSGVRASASRRADAPRGPAASALRPGCRPRLHPGRPRRLPGRRDPPGRGRHGFALAAALLNAVFGFCLGCEMYLLIRRVAPGAQHPSTTNPAHTNANRAENTKEEEATHEPRNRTGHR